MRDKDQILLESLYETIIQETMSFFVNSDVIGSVGYGDVSQRYSDDIYDLGGTFDNIAWNIINKKMSEEEIENLLNVRPPHIIYPEGDDDEIDNNDVVTSGHLIFDTTGISPDLIKTISDAINYYKDEHNLNILSTPYKENNFIKYPIKITKPKDFEDKNPPYVTLPNSLMYLMLRLLNIGGKAQKELKIDKSTNLNVYELSSKIEKIIKDDRYLEEFTLPAVEKGSVQSPAFTVDDIKNVLQKIQNLLKWCLKRDVRVVSIA